MTYECKYCSAKFWEQERQILSCCNDGKICLIPLSRYDDDLKKLLLYDGNAAQRFKCRQ